jgi:hypothetical protein
VPALCLAARGSGARLKTGSGKGKKEVAVYPKFWEQFHHRIWYTDAWQHEDIINYHIRISFSCNVSLLLRFVHPYFSKNFNDDCKHSTLVTALVQFQNLYSTLLTVLGFWVNFKNYYSTLLTVMVQFQSSWTHEGENFIKLKNSYCIRQFLRRWKYDGLIRIDDCSSVLIKPAWTVQHATNQKMKAYQISSSC